MNKLKQISLFLAVTLIATVTAGGTAIAQTNLDETKSIDMDAYLSSLLTLEAGDVLNVNIQVTAGGSVDVLLMKSSEYVKFLNVVQTGQAGTFNYYISGSSLNIKSKQYSFTAPEGGDYYLVIDNSVYPTEGGANPTGSVNVHYIITVSSPTPIPTSIRTPIPTPTPNKNQGIIDNANRLLDDYVQKSKAAVEAGKRATTTDTKETYIEWKLRNEEAIESGQRYASYITENRDVLKQNTEILDMIPKNKARWEENNRLIYKKINTLESPGFGTIITVIGIILAIAIRRR